MSTAAKSTIGIVAVIGAFVVLHGWMNLGWFTDHPRAKVRVGHLPVTCHLTCPVTSWVTQHSAEGTDFVSKRYTNFGAITDDLAAKNLDATFMLAPLAMVLAREGSRPVKIVHLGHRDGTALVVPKDSPFQTFADLKGKKIAIPHWFSNQRILIERLKEQNGMSDADVTLIPFSPPEMPVALKAGQFDAYIVGEPHAAKAELGGFGRVLYHTKDIWPNFISCVCVVTQDMIDTQPDLVQELVSGITASGQWIDEGPNDRPLAGVYREGETVPDGLLGSKDDDDRARALLVKDDFVKDTGFTPRMQAAQIAGMFYGQPPELLKYVLTQPPDRVRYTNLYLHREDFEEIQKYAVKLGFFSKRPVTAADPLKFEDYCDPRFEQGTPREMPYRK